MSLVVCIPNEQFYKLTDFDAIMPNLQIGLVNTFIYVKQFNVSQLCVKGNTKQNDLLFLQFCPMIFHSHHINHNVTDKLRPIN